MSSMMMHEQERENLESSKRASAPKAADESPTATPAKYCSIVFMQGEEADEAMSILDEQGELAAIEHLKQWDFGGESEHMLSITDAPPWGLSDRLFKDGNGYVLSWQPRLPYISLTRIL